MSHKLYKVLVDCPINRYKHGEIGKSLDNDFSIKYFVKLDLGEGPKTTLFNKEIKPRRIFYFYKHEVEEQNDTKN